MHPSWIPFLAAATMLVAGPALAHAPTSGGGFLAGTAHPLFGTDHLLAMLAVGAFAALQGGRQVWIVPAAFVVALIAGAGLAFAGVAMPLVEPGILASCVVLGLMLILAARLPVVAGVLAVALFGLFHGHAHGSELPAGATAGLFVAGFALASVALHVAGVGFGTLARRLPALRLAPAAGAGIAAFGLIGLAAL